MSEDSKTNVAIACQGGGSHTAFTAGVLQRLLSDCDWDDEYELVGLSGTSGGAFTALAMWYGLVTADKETAIGLLEDIWDDLSATAYSDRTLNSWVQFANTLERTGVPLPEVSPYDVPGNELGKERIRTVLERHIDFEAIPEHCKHGAPELVVGTVDVNAGVFETFTNESVTVDAILASAAVPNLFEAVEINGHYHWDGLFSQNPPVRDLMLQPPENKPEELWIVQINPQQFEGEPRSREVIADRRNELSGNISLNQELGFIKRVNEWVADGTLPADEFTQTDIHRIQMGKRFHCSTKLDRSPDFINELVQRGHSQAGEFLDQKPE
ncbi:patatin-like phospholipase family protein [Halovenus salina]|uniref:patatin-like phospholipase family protein n=1 Tax=Halovenus salina TaxID=1510225 RepID=UPI00226091A2|nr:patatin-like phospholipase family protein [Halovenus salina]